MVTGRIKLGAKEELSRKSLSRGQLEGFFYGSGYVHQRKVGRAYNEQCCQAPNFSDNYGRVAQSIGTTIGMTSELSTGLCGVSDSGLKCRFDTCPCRFFQDIFYDIPSRKRDVRGTNNLHTGATLSGVGEGQRLRKGFQEQQKRGSFTYGSNPFQFESWEWPSDQFKLSPHWLRRSRPTACPESLSSAAENKAYRRRIRGYER